MNFSVQQVSIFPTRGDAQRSIAQFDEWGHAAEFAKTVSSTRQTYRFYLWREDRAGGGESRGSSTVDAVFEQGKQVR